MQLYQVSVLFDLTQEVSRWMSKLPRKKQKTNSNCV